MISNKKSQVLTARLRVSCLAHKHLCLPVIDMSIYLIPSLWDGHLRFEVTMDRADDGNNLSFTSIYDFVQVVLGYRLSIHKYIGDILGYLWIALDTGVSSTRNKGFTFLSTEFSF